MASTGATRVLVTAASKHGGTAEVATMIAQVLTERGVQAVVMPVEEAHSVAGYDAVVLGSAVYAGHWLAPATGFVQAHAAALTARPVWLFSSGPVGDPPKPADDPVDVADLVAATSAREHRVFAGRLDRDRLGWRDKAIVVALRAPEGDFRPWDEIRAWATSIADQLAEAGTRPA